MPYEVLLNPGETQSFRVRALDANGFTVDENVDPKSVKWGTFIPPTALVKATMKGSFNADGQLVADARTTTPSAGAVQGVLGDLKGYIKGRVLPGLPARLRGLRLRKYRARNRQDTSPQPTGTRPRRCRRTGT